MTDFTLYQPKQPPIATLLVVHGMAEHQGRYQAFAQFLVNHQIAVMTFDHLGHGKKSQHQHTLGYMGNPDPAEQMITHVMQHAKLLADTYPNVPHFILGHSMGSFITRCIIQRFGSQFAGAILVGTSAPNVIAAAFLPVTRLLNQLAPTKPNQALSTLLNQFNNLPFITEKSLSGFNWLNSDQSQLKCYLADPLCGFAFTNNGYYALMQLMQQGTRSHWWQCVPKALPMLFASGSADPIGQMGKGIPIITQTLAEQGFINVTAKQYPHMRHEILLETAHLRVFNDILAWLTNLITH